jgi:hypothetical protein
MVNIFGLKVVNIRILNKVSKKSFEGGSSILVMILILSRYHTVTVLGHMLPSVIVFGPTLLNVTQRETW